MLRVVVQNVGFGLGVEIDDFAAKLRPGLTLSLGDSGGVETLKF